EYLSNGIVNLELATPDSEFNGKIIPYQDKDSYDDGAANLRLSDGASWNVEGNSTAKNVNITSNGGNINLGSDAKTVAINTLSGDTLKVTTDNIQSKVEIVSNTNQNLTVAAGENITASLTDANQANTLQGLADVVEVGTGNKEKTVTIAAGDVNGAITAVTDDNGKIATVKEEANTANAAVSDMASISMMTWRQENNDMNKRLGELRDSKGQYGAWARMARGESKYGAQGVKNQYNYYQIGYDEKLSTDPHWTVGVALTRTEGNSTFKDGSGENNHTGVAVYGSYLGENGSFIDLIAKYSRMDNEYKTSAGVGDADYKTNGYSVSAEYGKRFTKDNGLWIEPQVELTYGTVGSANYMTSKDANVRQDGIDSLVGRVGFALGKNIKAGNVYARASYLYDFDGEANVTYSKGGVTRSFEQDLGGGWWEVGIGSNINLSNATHLYFDVEKTYGGDVATPWQWNVGVRYSF
ncbi:MAG: autotransporter outer membrane beta-barrel domain-containing protein, partial [Phascolarctobacterium sp.]